MILILNRLKTNKTAFLLSMIKKLLRSILTCSYTFCQKGNLLDILITFHHKKHDRSMSLDLSRELNKRASFAHIYVQMRKWNKNVPYSESMTNSEYMICLSIEKQKKNDSDTFCRAKPGFRSVVHSDTG